jgi:hypothetical protein
MPTNTTDEGNLPPGVVADLLADDRRRRALELLEESGTLTLGTLARRIAAAETGVAPEEVPESLAAEAPTTSGTTATSRASSGSPRPRPASPRSRPSSPTTSSWSSPRSRPG